MRTATKPKRVLKKPVHPNQIAITETLQAMYLERWLKGYETGVILRYLGRKYFKSYSRITQLVQPTKLTKGLTREIDLD